MPTSFRTCSKLCCDVDDVCHDVLHLPSYSLPKVKPGGLILTHYYSSPSNVGMMVEVKMVCVCWGGGEMHSLVLSLSFFLNVQGRMGQWEPPDMMEAQARPERLTRVQSGQGHLNTPTALFVTSMLPPQHPSLCPVQSRWSTRFVD